ncbi:DUF1320 domain-containing protein [Acinetobacter sp. SWAC5]|uniref:gp436 family protein n=1 Tax=Acinetobacter sp. SWAC5 TaxID=2293835 RepID=UPI000E34A6A4|nr:DUF1320 domain-containing protein [Acinetobacter sp. SWAC5]RFS32205.1 DUF1320 domain-containing protein [Acinetobacter sp. SWAC5]
MYATEVDLKTRFGSQVIDDLKLGCEGGTDPVDVVQVALQDAEEEINGYIGGRYSLPLANVPSNLKRIACDIARYRLYTEAPLEHITKLYEEAVSFLKLIATNKAHLQIQNVETNEIVNDTPKNKPSTAPIGTTYTGGVFGDDVLGKMPSIK